MLVPPPTYCAVAIDVPLDRPFTYRVPDALKHRVQRGVRVLAPWRQGAMTGLVLAMDVPPPEGFDETRIRSIVDVLDAKPAVPEAQLALTEWIADYYAAPIGASTRLAMPPQGGRKARRRVRFVGPMPEGVFSEMAERLALQLELHALPMVPRELLDAVRHASHADLSLLEEAGVIVSEYDEAGGVRVQTVDRVTLVGRDGNRLGAAQERVVTHLENHGPTTDDELRTEYKTPRSVLRALTERGVITLATEEVLRDPFEAERVRRDADPPLTPEQVAALETLERIRIEGPRVALLHGVTGSGKTEVYVRAARATIARGQRVVVLLPEIALTPQFVGVFRAAIEAEIAVLHSGLTPGEKYDQWRQIRRGDVQVIIGARSALFAPCEDLGLIIVDEEHDPSFKQGEGVRYNARDAAVVLAHRVGAQCVLGSATPSLESLQNAEEGRYQRINLKQRVMNRPMPFIDVINMAHHHADAGDPLSQYVSPPLQQKVRMTARRGEQTILFINRRGYAPSIQCVDCGEVLECPDCDISLTFHRRRDEVTCHYCGFSRRTPTECPTCRSQNMSREGAGTEKIAESIADGFGDLRVGRLDRDSARGRGLRRVLTAFRRGELDVLVGTQMVTKGHDFPNVTLVGIIDADQALRFPDFRSGERTFQLLTQVAGRAGRGTLPGDVLLQTYRPEHYVIEAVAAADYQAFADDELHFRQRLVYPPFGYLFALRFDCPVHTTAMRYADQMARYIRDHGDDGIRVTGPVDAPVARVRNRYRIHVLVRAGERPVIRRAVRLVRHLGEQLEKDMQKADVRWSIDVDAIQLL